MKGPLHWFRRRNVIEQKSADGLDLALATIDTLPGKTFCLKGPRMYYRKQPDSEIRRFIQEDLPKDYHYSSSVTRSEDKRGTEYVRIKIEGWTGLRGTYRRPSPFDQDFTITTKIDT